MTISRNAVIPSPTLAKSNLFSSMNEGPELGLESPLPPTSGEFVVLTDSPLVVVSGGGGEVCVVGGASSAVVVNGTSVVSVKVVGGGQSVVETVMGGSSTVVVVGISVVAVVVGVRGRSQLLRQSSSE